MTNVTLHSSELFFREKMIKIDKQMFAKMLDTQLKASYVLIIHVH